MPTKDTQNIEANERGPRAGVSRSEPGGRAQRGAGAARAPDGPPLADLPPEVRDRLSDQVIDELLDGARTEQEIVGPGGLLADLTRRLVERAMSAELTEHLGYARHHEPPGGAGNTRNGSTPKTLATEHGAVRIKTPRDRTGTFEPQLVRKGQRRFEGFDDKILALYARGLSTRDIEAHLEEIYGVRRQGRARSDQPRHRRRHRGRQSVAAAAAGRRLPGRVPRLPGLEDPRGRDRAAPRLLPRARRDHRRRPRCARPVVPRDRGREVLDAGPHRSEAARRRRHPDLLRRRAQGVPRGDRGDLPPDRGADLRRAPEPPQPQVRPAARARAGRPRSQTDLHRRRRRRLPARARALRRAMGSAVPRDHARLA